MILAYHHTMLSALPEFESGHDEETDSRCLYQMTSHASDHQDLLRC